MINKRLYLQGINFSKRYLNKYNYLTKIKFQGQSGHLAIMYPIGSILQLGSRTTFQQICIWQLMGKFMINYPSDFALTNYGNNT